MPATFPFLTSYDPVGTSEGALDPLGLYQIADQLAVQLVPAVRERMQRIRMLTAMAVGAVVTEGLDDDQRNRDASPYLVWEWLVVEALTRKMRDDPGLWGVPGTHVAARALDQQGYLDARGYLKTPRIFGFTGVYKRLAIHLGVIDIHLGAGPNAEELVEAWARGLHSAGLPDANTLINRWAAAVKRSLTESPPRTRPSWGNADWEELARAFAPAERRTAEKNHLRKLLHSSEDRRLGALPTIWQILSEFDDESFQEQALHDRLEELEPLYAPLLAAIRAYEAFARSLQDGFDVLRVEAARRDAQGFSVPGIASNLDFTKSVAGLHERYCGAYRALGETIVPGLPLQNSFMGRFVAFSEPMDVGTSALALCVHHEAVQHGKSADGKRPWFDRLGQDRIYIRHAYRIPPRSIEPGRYVHDYRGLPIRRFWTDLS
jgi:hypothetical protein